MLSIASLYRVVGSSRLTIACIHAIVSRNHSCLAARRRGISKPPPKPKPFTTFHMKTDNTSSPLLRAYYLGRTPNLDLSPDLAFTAHVNASPHHVGITWHPRVSKKHLQQSPLKAQCRQYPFPKTWSKTSQHRERHHRKAAAGAPASSRARRRSGRDTLSGGVYDNLC